jgi:hypothetical protein
MNKRTLRKDNIPRVKEEQMQEPMSSHIPTERRYRRLDDRNAKPTNQTLKTEEPEYT